MENVSILQRYGLFDAKVPRYTSYPPANRFLHRVGTYNQADWLAAVPAGQPISIYVHIPFCRRLCWFCACRTQGTTSLSPVEGYVHDLINEISTVARLLTNAVPMARLHLGGGTPTLLSAPLMDQLLTHIFQSFRQADEFEFSVEIDPTEAADDVLSVLSSWGMKRASVGVQDFQPDVQRAIGRTQGVSVTQTVIDRLRAGGLESLNIDLLYGLPNQTVTSLVETLDQVVGLHPDRLALYGYAHVPHMSKRQVMIPSSSLPGPKRRFEMARVAAMRLAAQAYDAIGIDHFALSTDSLARAVGAGQLRRNFQGYTDDPCDTLIGFGASAISRFKQGYSQNEVATGAYRRKVSQAGLAAEKGYVMRSHDALVADLIDGIMCGGRIDIAQMVSRHPTFEPQIKAMIETLQSTFPEAVDSDDGAVWMKPETVALSRIVAAHLDKELTSKHRHSSAA